VISLYSNAAPAQGVTSSLRPPVRITPEELWFFFTNFHPWVKIYHNLDSFALRGIFTD